MRHCCTWKGTEGIRGQYLHVVTQGDSLRHQYHISRIWSMKYAHDALLFCFSLVIQSSAVVSGPIYHDIFVTMRWQQQNLNQTCNLLWKPHTSPLPASYGVSIVRICDKIDRVITAPHSINMAWPSVAYFTIFFMMTSMAFGYDCPA